MSQHYNQKAVIANNIPSLSYRKKNLSISPEKVKCKKIGNYILSTTIEKGTFSKVKLGIHLPTQKNVAIKILDRDKIRDKNYIERISREIHILTVLIIQILLNYMRQLQVSVIFILLWNISKGESFSIYIFIKKINRIKSKSII